MTGGSMSQLEGPFRLPEAPVEADLVAKSFRGLGEPTRLRILELLRDEGELSVGELVQRLGVPQPKVSNHLACLRWCGFIEARRQHRVVFNRIADTRALKMLELAHALLEDNGEPIAACWRIVETQCGGGGKSSVTWDSPCCRPDCWSSSLRSHT